MLQLSMHGADEVSSAGVGTLLCTTASLAFEGHVTHQCCCCIIVYTYADVHVCFQMSADAQLWLIFVRQHAGMQAGLFIIATGILQSANACALIFTLEIVTLDPVTL